MKHLLTVLVAVSALVAGCGREQDARERDPDLHVTSAQPADVSPPANDASSDLPTSAQGRPRIVFLGNSLTAGYGLASKEQAVPALVQKRLDKEGYNVEVVNQGVSGDTTAGGVSRLDWALSGDVRILVIELGGNDGLRGLPVEATKRNLSQIITTAKQRGVRVLLTGMEAPPSYGPDYTSQFRQVFRDLAREQDVPFMPFFLEGVAGIPRLNQPDGIHPTAEGAVIVEQAVWKSLKPLLEQVRHAEAARQRRRTDTTSTR
jgi:acyl-CoA thioesterase I